ncbi:MAG: hypothetical protein U1E69_09090 [Tabrizicola sp.]|uniref:5'-methylthioadenosine/S-adenosylhomocysteine nucleosidase family protein n=1 Tax=Tabrizicola sp. TaxID=2005166 RepID=UPI002ABAA79F|nr:hypothetical protein [Tabrizicola sp.]MDZ4086945.1 hypothetical protein [Tabrizicola sp.]
MTANISQIIEYSHSYTQLKNIVEKLIKAGILISTSHSTDLGDFVASRQRIYRNVAEKYPMYFGNTGELERFPILKRNNFSMTKLLRRDIFDYDVTRFPVLGSHALDTDLKKFETGIGRIQAMIMSNPEIAITRGNIERIANQGDLSEPVLASTAHIFSARYFDHYKENNDAVIPSGVGLVGYLDDLTFFPQYDIRVLTQALVSLGWHRLKRLHEVRDRAYASYGNALHRDFVLHLNSFLGATFTEVSRRANRPLGADNADTMRRMVCNTASAFLDIAKDNCNRPITSFDEFLEISIDAIRDAATREGKRNTNFAREWESTMGTLRTVTVLLLTATDTEDDAVRGALALNGFKHQGFRSAGKAVASEYSRGANQKIFHVRSSAGSTGASGSELTANDAFTAIQPNYTISVGICFGLKRGKQSIGDILVSEMVTDYEMVRKGEAETRERGTRVPAASKLLSASRALRSQYNEGVPLVHHGELLSGMKLIDDADFRTELISRFPDAIGGEMEATGIAASASRLLADWIVVKSICDWAEGKKDGDQELAARNAAEFALKLSGIIFATDLSEGGSE